MPYDDEVEGDEDEVEGAVMGYEGPMVNGMEVVGYTDSGAPVVVGARRRKPARHAVKGHHVVVHKPDWRKTQLAPGVIAPDQGLLPLPLTGPGGVLTFNAATPSISFEGQIQKPFRGERLLVSTVRTGTSAVGRLISQLFVGTDLQQLDVPGFDAEQVGTPTAFGVRLTMKPAQPGVFIRLVTTLSSGLSGTDTIFTSVTLLGRLIH